MILKRIILKRLFADIIADFGLTWEEILNDKYYRRLLLNPENLDSTQRIKQCSHPQNIEALNEIIKEEMLTDIPIAELVFRPAKTPYLYDLSSKRKDEIAEKYAKIAEEMNAEFDYYKYVQTATSAPEFQQKKSSEGSKFKNLFKR